MTHQEHLMVRSLDSPVNQLGHENGTKTEAEVYASTESNTITELTGQKKVPRMGEVPLGIRYVHFRTVYAVGVTSRLRQVPVMTRRWGSLSLLRGGTQLDIPFKPTHS